MSLAAYAIPTLQEVKDYLKISIHDSDAILETWINHASSSIEQYTNRKIVVQSVSGEIYDGDGSDTLFVRYWPVTQLSTESAPTTAQKLASLQYRNGPDEAWTDIETDIDHIFIDVNWPFIKLYEQTFPKGMRNVKISYKAGFSTIPGDIWRVSVEMVADMWNQSKHGTSDRLGKSTVSIQSSSTTYKDLKPEWEKVLDYYRVRPV